MAPRGRPRRVGLRRIDAAVDALLPFGFEKDLVCKTVNDLLKVYDGDSGWVFIEEASYQLVIDTILEEQEKEERRKALEACRDNSKAPEVCESSHVSGTGGKSMEEEVTAEARALEGCGQDAGAGETSSHLKSIVDRPFAGANVSWKDISCVNQGLRHNLHQLTLAAQEAAGEQQSSGSPDIGQTHGHHHSSPPRPRRAPCYGWISEEEEDEVHDPPQQQETVQRTVGLGPRTTRTKRKSRWDLKPSDL